MFIFINQYLPTNSNWNRGNRRLTNLNKKKTSQSISVSFQIRRGIVSKNRTSIDKKLPLYKTEEDEVMLLVERVNEAQRFARMVSVVKHVTFTITDIAIWT